MSGPDDATHCYVGIMPGDRFGFICVDHPDYSREIGRDIARTVKKGGKVEHLTIEAGRQRIAQLNFGGDR